jgi:hypothetical protein
LRRSGGGIPSWSVGAVSALQLSVGLTWCSSLLLLSCPKELISKPNPERNSNNDSRLSCPVGSIIIIVGVFAISGWS